MKLIFTFLLAICLAPFPVWSQPAPVITNAGLGWAKNSVNAVIFRKNSLCTWKDLQFIAYYDNDSHLVVGKRKVGTDKWTIRQTTLTGKAEDAHNTISMIVDGNGFLHITWDHHNNPLNYVRSIAAGSLELTEKIPMTGENEKRVTYPEFYRLASGGLLFFYREGESGQGNLVLNSYDIRTGKWSRLHTNLVDGQGERNAYWQACIDGRGWIHLSWVWRETPDVASNHDLGYACSKDGGRSWQRSDGSAYQMPITALNAEYAARIPQKSELINQTSMSADNHGNPFIATYWREANEAVPQYHVVYLAKKKWVVLPLNFRKTAFSLSGVGTKRIPVSRPQIMVNGDGASFLMVFRDEERGNKASVISVRQLNKPEWTITDLTSFSLGSWEPSYDTERWKSSFVLSLFIQNVDQVDREGKSDLPPQPVQVLEWKPAK